MLDDYRKQSLKHRRVPPWEESHFAFLEKHVGASLE